MYLWPGMYNIVLYKAGYAVVCRKVDIGSNTSNTEDFKLFVTDTGTVGGTASIPDADPDQSAVLSFRQDAVCESAVDEQTIEVYSESLADGGSYAVNLPTGTYDLVASTEGEDTIAEEDVSIEKDLSKTQDIDF
jgi:hypothetical protein